MGFDNDCILNIQSLAGEYFCAVCRTLVYPNEAMQAPCTHLYCKPCLTYVVSTTHACPYDGYRVTEADSKPLLESNKTLADTIGKIQVHCLYYRTGCTWQGSLSDSTTHGPTCTFGESAVLCNKCGIQLKHRQVQEHAQNCSGVQSQVQQPGGVQDNTSTAATSAPDQTQAGVQTVQTSQAPMSQVSTSLVPSQSANQTANPAVQPQATQAATLTPEQLYQQQQQQQQQYQQQYQQYYQQYPGYDPYQQNYQYYYQYPQGAQPITQGYGQPPQGYGQAQALPITQAQQQVQLTTQPIVQAQQQVQPQVPTQAAQPPLQPQAQPAGNAHPQAPSVGQLQPHTQGQGQTQPQMQGQGQAPLSHAPYNQAEAQPHNQSQPVPQQQLQGPQYAQTHPQMVHPYAQPYSQSQTQPQYSHPQPQMQSQVQSQAPVHPPQQPFLQSAQPPTQNPVMAYQSYPQPQLHSQAQMGAGQPAHIAGAQYPSQMQGQFPSQAAQTRPPQSYANIPNQQQPATMAAQGQPPSGPSAQQLPVYPHVQQPGYPIQQRPSLPQQYGQQQSFPGQGPYMQHQPPLAAQLHAQGPPQIPPQPPQNYVQPQGVRPNVPHNYAGRPVGGQTIAHPYAQTAGPAGAAQVRPQHHQVSSNNHFPSAGQQPTQSQQMLSGEKPRDPTTEKGLQDKNDRSKEGRDTATAYSSGQKGDEMKSKASNGFAVNADGNNSNYLSGSKMAPSSEDNHAQAKLNTKTDNGEGFPEGPSGVAGKDAQNLKNMAKNGAGDSAQPSSSPKPQSKLQPHGANSFPNLDQGRNQQHPMSHGPSAQHKPGVFSMPQSVTHPNNSQQSAVSGHPSNQLRPQGLGQASSGSFPLENPSGGMRGPGSAGSLSRPGNVNSYQGNHPPHHTGHPPANPLVGPSFDGNRHDAFRHETEKFAAHSSGSFDGRQPDSLLKPFPHREFEDDFGKLPRPPHMQAGPLSTYGPRFPSTGPLDHGFDRDPAFERDVVSSGAPRAFPPFHPRDVNERQRAFPDDDMRRADFSQLDLPRPLPGPGFGRHRMNDVPPRSPRRDYPDFPSRMFGPYGDVDRNDPRAFENSKPLTFPPEPFGNPHKKGRFPAPSRGDLDVASNQRMGEHFGPNQDLPSHFQRGGHMGLRSLPLGEPSGFGRPGEFSRMEPPLSGNLPPHILFGDSYGGEKTGLPLVGEPGFRSGFGFPRFPHDDGFHPREMEPFENMRKRKLGSIMCRICKVECGSVDNLELHSQSREHQQKAREVVLSIKHQNKKKQKAPKDRAFFEEGRDGGRPKHSNFQGRGNKR